MRLPSMRIIALLAGVAVSCSPADNADGLPSGVWAPGVHNQAVETVLGQVAHGGSEYLTQWHSLEVDRLRSDAPEVLGDFRDALFVSTPSHFFVPLESSEQKRVLKTAVRRDQGHNQKPLHCEVFWNGGDDQLLSLAKLTWDAAPKVISEEWRDLEVEVPMQAGRLEFVTRDPVLGGQSSSGLTVAWQAPWVGSLDQGQNGGVQPYPDVLLLSIDTFRADALDRAPGLKSWVEQGQLWSNAVSPSNWTLPSYASLFTGLAANEHGAGRGSFALEASGEIEDRRLTPIRTDRPTLAQQFRQRGYATAMIHQSPMLESWTGFANGFERYLRLNDQTDVALQHAQDWWRQNQGRPRFLVLQLMAPHLPYRFGPGPDPLAELDLVEFFLEDHTPEQRKKFFDLSEADRQIVRQRYDEEVRRMDNELRPWLETLLPSSARPESAPNWIFALHSDHGEEFWEQQSFEHGHSFDDSVIRVPIAIVAPGRLQPMLSNADVPAHGIGGTVLAVAGISQDWPSRIDQAPDSVLSNMPFYRADSGGRRFAASGEEQLPFRPMLNSGGQQAAISVDKMKMLEELGYLAAKDETWDNSDQAPGNK